MGDISNLSLAKNIAQWLRERYCGPYGLLSRRVDGLHGTILNSSPIIEELGDYVQYTLILGNILGDESLCDWSKTQVKTALQKSQTTDGLIHSLALQPGLKGYLHRVTYLQLATCDTLWGLVECLRLWPDSGLRARIEKFVEGTLEFATGRKHLPVYGIFHWHKISLHLPLSNPMLAGYWIESLVMLNKVLNDNAYLSGAVEIAKAFADEERFGRFGLFPLRVSTSVLGDLLTPLFDIIFRWRGRLVSGKSIMVKGDVYFIFGLLALYRATEESWIREVILRWKSSVLEHLRTLDSRFYNYWLGFGEGAQGLSLGTNHSLVEVMLDIFHDLHDEEAFHAASSAARAWLAKRVDIGLIPDNEDTPVAFLDPQVDFSINLLKLWQISGEPFWRDSANALSEALTQYHRLPFGMAWGVDTRTGTKASHEIETKFLGLFLKLPLIFHFALSKKMMILDDADLRQLATDR